MRVWLKDIRTAAGYSTYKTAELAGISQSYYASIEAGARGNPLNVDVAKKIAEALGFDWTRFYEDTGKDTEQKGGVRKWKLTLSCKALKK